MNRNSSVHHLVETGAINQPEATAIVAADKTSLTYMLFHRQVQDVVRQLNGLGIGRNDPVAIVLPNGPEMAVAFLAVASGATCAPLNPAYKYQEFMFFLSDLEAKALITLVNQDSAAIEVAARLNIPIIELNKLPDNSAGTFTLTGQKPALSKQTGLAEPEDVALVLHTSGTTARPKIVPLTHQNLVASADNIKRTLRLTSTDACLNIMPLFHIHGLLAALLASIKAGGSVVCTPGFDASRFYYWLDEQRPTWYTAVPTMHQAILRRSAAYQETIKNASLRFIRSSSSSLPPLIMDELERTFQVPVIEAYGMTEASHQIASNPLPPETRKAGSVGKAEGPKVAIMSEESDELEPFGGIGEIVIRGRNVTSGYANNPVSNSRAFVNGWFRTGDQGQIDQDGYLYITGRLKEIINRGGEKIAPREIDEVLLQHPNVAQAVTFALPDEVLGEDVAAAIVLRRGETATQQDIRRFASLQLANFKIPRLIFLLDEIPKGPTGKIQRVGLAEKLELNIPRQTKAQDLVAPSTKTEVFLFQVWVDVLKSDEFGVNDNFTDVGGDSILAAKLAMSIRKSLDLELPLVEFYDASTIREQASLIEKRVEAG